MATVRQLNTVTGQDSTPNGVPSASMYLTGDDAGTPVLRLPGTGNVVTASDVVRWHAISGGYREIVAARVWVDSDSTSGQGGVVGGFVGDDAAGAHPLDIRVTSGRQLRLVGRLDGGDRVVSSSVLSQGWHNVIGIFAASAGAWSASLYIDGATASNSSSYTSLPVDLSDRFGAGSIYLSGAIAMRGPIAHAAGLADITDAQRDAYLAATSGYECAAAIAAATKTVEWQFDAEHCQTTPITNPGDQLAGRLRAIGGKAVSLCIPTSSNALAVDCGSADITAGAHALLTGSPTLIPAARPRVPQQLATAAAFNGLANQGEWPLADKRDLSAFTAGFTLGAILQGDDPDRAATIIGGDNGSAGLRIQHSESAGDDLHAALYDGTNTLSARTAAGGVGVYGSALRLLLVTFDLAADRVLMWLDAAPLTLTAISSQAITPFALPVNPYVAAHNSNGSMVSGFDGSLSAWWLMGPVTTQAQADMIQREATQALQALTGFATRSCSGPCTRATA